MKRVRAWTEKELEAFIKAEIKAEKAYFAKHGKDMPIKARVKFIREYVANWEGKVSK